MLTTLTALTTVIKPRANKIEGRRARLVKSHASMQHIQHTWRWRRQAAISVTQHSMDVRTDLLPCTERVL